MENQKLNRRRDILLKAAGRGKYSPLFHYLNEYSINEFPITFAELEGILGFELPDSARIHRPWWANQGMRGGHSHALAWEMAGWKTSRVDMEGEKLVFVRDASVKSKQYPNDKFWIYVNEPNNVVTIHLSDCSFCNNGRGLKAGKSNANGQWFGPFSEDSANQNAIKSNKRSIIRCAKCN
jgi:hypothetical protein